MTGRKLRLMTLIDEFTRSPPRTIKALQIQEIVRDLPDRKDERERICGIVKDDHRRQQVDRNV